MKVLSLLVLTVLIGFSSCASKSGPVLHPIEGVDFRFLEEGEEFKAPKMGVFMSEYYLEEVVKAKVEE